MVRCGITDLLDRSVGLLLLPGGQILPRLVSVAHAGLQGWHYNRVVCLLLDPANFLTNVLPKSLPIVQKIFIVIVVLMAAIADRTSFTTGYI